VIHADLSINDAQVVVIFVVAADAADTVAIKWQLKLLFYSCARRTNLVQFSFTVLSSTFLSTQRVNRPEF
jgi:hypothetical protein